MTIQETIKKRRTIKPLFYTGEKVKDSDIQEMLESANWAPTHKFTEPWRFIVYSGNSLLQFGKDHAAMYKEVNSGDKFVEKIYKKLSVITEKSSHMIAVMMKRDEQKRIPKIEEICAVASAMQNMMLVATEKGFANIWSTGGMIYHQKMKDYLGLGDEDEIIGFLYIGISEKEPKAKRLSPVTEKTIWKR